MIEIWRVRVIAEAKVHTGDCESREAGKEWAANKLHQLGHEVSVTWRDREKSSVAVPGVGLEAHVTLRE
jgi:hypothetical protein